MGYKDVFLRLPRRVIESLENSKAPFIYFVLTPLFAVILRCFLELFSDHTTPYLEIYSHYMVSYISIVMIIVLVARAATKNSIIRICKVILPSTMIIVLPPIIDLIISKGKGLDMAYILPEMHKNILATFLSFFGSFSGMGITPGIRIEIALILVGLFVYFYIKNSSFLVSIIYTAVSYSLIFAYLTTPIIIKAMLSVIGIDYTYSDALIYSFYLVMIFFTGLPLLYLAKKDYFMVILKDIRPMRTAHYLLMFAVGSAVGMKYASFSLSSSTLFCFILVGISIIFAWLFSVITNNLADYRIDSVSNRKRPLIKSRLDKSTYKSISWFFLAMSVIYALAAGIMPLLLVLVFIGSYFIYSMPPLRIKRLTFLSKAVISLNSLVLIMAGFAITAGSLDDFPHILTLFILTVFTTAANFIDIKDYEGDKKEGIRTLPVVMGLKKSKLLIGAFFAISYPISFFVIKRFVAFPVYMVIPLIFIGLVQFWLINRERYDERPVFIVHLLSIIALFFI